jgi:hypothetical protein
LKKKNKNKFLRTKFPSLQTTGLETHTPAWQTSGLQTSPESQTIEVKTHLPVVASQESRVHKLPSSHVTLLFTHFPTADEQVFFLYKKRRLLESCWFREDKKKKLP